MAVFSTWTSALIQQTLEKLRLGINVDMSCFYERDVQLKASHLLFKQTAEEVAEFDKCMIDAVYFVEKYCTFMTDYGRKTVKLRPYQKKLLKSLTAEVFIEKLNDNGPKNRNNIIMASRQTAKCLVFNNLHINKDNETSVIPINLLYFKQKSHLTFLEKVKLFLMNVYQSIDKW